MEIKKTAMAGSMESSDCMVTVRPGIHGIQIDLQSDVKVMFGESILATVRQTLEELAVSDAEVSVLDRGVSGGFPAPESIPCRPLLSHNIPILL